VVNVFCDLKQTIEPSNFMSHLKIYNTLSRQKEIFQPASINVKDNVGSTNVNVVASSKPIGIYVCGMTVYDYCHIGNARVNVFFDFVVRYLRFLGYRVNYVRNITDIDDKIINRANECNQSSSEVATFFTAAMHEDMRKLGVSAPTYEPKVTEHIPEIINVIKILLDKNYAYIAVNGDVYYDTTKFKAYGEFAHQDLENLKVGVRVDVNEVKRHPLDFVLWKMAKPHEPAWPSLWGAGRPGWHIECSAMARHYLGDHFDIHGGGADLQFPHHQNELAQSEAVCGCKFVNYWMHVGFVNVNDEKMSKSLGNFFTVREVLQYYQPEVLRFFLLMAHYRSQLNYSVENLNMAKAALTRLYTALRGLTVILPNVDADLTSDVSRHISDGGGEYFKYKYFVPFVAALNDDFNVPLALGYMFELARHINKLRENQPLPQQLLPQHRTELLFAATMLRDKMGAILGILQRDPEQFFQCGDIKNIKDGNDISGVSASGNGESGVREIDVEQIQQLIDRRVAARKSKDWIGADQIREQLKNMGIILEDTPNGTLWKQRN